MASKLTKAVEKLRKEWEGTDSLLRDEILRCGTVMVRAAKEAGNAISLPLIDAAKDVLTAAVPKLLLGTSVEDLLIEAASAIPELSPYVRQLLGD